MLCVCCSYPHLLIRTQTSADHVFFASRWTRAAQRRRRTKKQPRSDSCGAGPSGCIDPSAKSVVVVVVVVSRRTVECHEGDGIIA